MSYAAPGLLMRTTLLSAALLLVACAAPGPERPPMAPELAFAERTDVLQAWSSWGLSGRLGLDDGQEGGSGRLDWRDNGDAAELQFRGALGQGAWRLNIEQHSARLERSDGSVSTAGDVDQLVRRETGWQLPVTALNWWVRGLAWPGALPAAELQFNDDGTPSVLEQLGWRITYTRYVDHGGQRLPSRLEARRGDVQVKLAVSRWLGGTR